LTEVVNSSTGAVTHQSFDAWGNTRSAADWRNASTVPLFASRGFTGHEHLEAFALINMNGRMYDPVLGRFLSPDPYVQMPDFSQNFNRYAYCLNNPLMYADPSGEKLKLWHWLLIDFFTGGTISAFTSTAATATITSTLAGTIVQTYINVWSGDCDRADNTWKIWFGLFKTDKNLSFGDRIIQFGSRFTWEGLQSWVGYNYSQLRNTAGKVDEVKYFGGATFAIDENVTGYNGWRGVSLGNYIDAKIPGNLDEDYPGGWIYSEGGLFWHEYGHTFDSQLYGLSYLLSIGLPSVIGAEWTERRANNWAWKYAEKHKYMDEWMYTYEFPLK